MSRDVGAVVDLAALRHNLSVARAAAPDSRILAVAKADAYGHGLIPVARALRGRVEGFAVSCLEEAVILREEGITEPIVMLEGFFETSELPSIARLGLEIVIHSYWQIEALELDPPQSPIIVWLKVDSGMHRIGLAPDCVRDAYRRLSEIDAVREIRFLTHLAQADDRDSDYTRYQLAEFARARAGLPGQQSIANSAGVLGWEEARHGWVRPGIMLYGASPFADRRPNQPALRPVMTLSSRLIAINRFRRGDNIGYAGSYICPEDMPVGVVAIGYGDGYPRHAGNGAPVLVNGRRTSVIGRVSMDMICVDLRGLPEARVHDPVTLWGRGLPIEEIAAHCGTISYELLCKLTGRVRFSYTDSDGQGTNGL